MKRVLLAALLGLFLALSPPAHGDQTPEEIFKAVVRIRAVIPKDARSASSLGTEREGSGVLIDAKGHILTIGYLVNEAETIEVFGLQDKATSATLVGYDQDTGFGLIRVDAPVQIEPVKLGDSQKLKVGDPVLVAGHGGADAAQGAAVVSRKEFAGYWEYLLDEAIYTTPAYANFGGAALIGRDGRLLGIGSLYTQLIVPGLGAMSCNVFVPIDLLPPILDDLMTKGRSSKPPRPWLGINSEEARGRIFITRVTSGGPAEKAGLQADDLVLTVGGKEINGLADFYRKIWALGNAGVDVPLTFLRGTEVRSVTVHSGDRFLSVRPRPEKRL